MDVIDYDKTQTAFTRQIQDFPWKLWLTQFFLFYQHDDDYLIFISFNYSYTMYDIYNSLNTKEQTSTKHEWTASPEA